MVSSRHGRVYVYADGADVPLLWRGAEVRVMKGDTLSLKQRLFVEAYLGKARGNATEAARLAGYKGNDRTLCVVGLENLAKPNIASAVSIRVDAALESMSADEVIAEIASVAKSPWKLFSSAEYDDDGNVINVTLRLGDKLRALELLGKYHKLFTEKVEHTGKDGGPIEILTPEQKAARVQELLATGLTRKPTPDAVN